MEELLKRVLQEAIKEKNIRVIGSLSGVIDEYTDEILELALNSNELEIVKIIFTQAWSPNWSQALLISVQQNSKKIIEWLFWKFYENSNKIDIEEMKAFISYLAIIKNSVDLFTLDFLDDFVNSQLIILLIKHDRFFLFRIYLPRQKNIDWDLVLRKATKLGKRNFIDLALSNLEIDKLNRQLLCSKALNSGNIEIFQLFEDSTLNWTELFITIHLVSKLELLCYILSRSSTSLTEKNCLAILLHSSKRGNLEICNFVLSQVNNEGKVLALLNASRFGHLEICLLLDETSNDQLYQGTIPTKKWEEVVQLAIQNENVSVVRHFAEKVPSTQFWNLMGISVARSGNQDLMNILSLHGANEWAIFAQEAIHAKQKIMHIYCNLRA